MSSELTGFGFDSGEAFFVWDGFRGWRSVLTAALVASLIEERKSKPDQSHSRGYSCQLIEMVRKQPEQDPRYRPRYGQKGSRPAWQDAGAEGGDAKQYKAE